MKPNVRWYCPLDASQTEIGRYSDNVLPALHEALAIETVTDLDTEHTDYEPGDSTPGMLPINLYNIGNSHLHCGIAELAMREPGIVILHDVSLLEMGLAYARHFRGFDLFRMVSMEYGAEAATQFDALYTGEDYDWHGHSQAQYDAFVTRYPIFRTFLGNALAVVVHSDYAFERVSRAYNGPVRRLKLPFPVAGKAPRRQHDKPQFTIVFCGHAGPNRRLRQFIEAWALLPEPARFALHIYGNVDRAQEILDLAAAQGLGGLIKVFGFVSDEVLTTAITEADLALNLRNPTMGEASASQLRYWAAGIPTLVSDTGWYGEQPDDAVIKIATCNERVELVEALKSIASGDGRLLSCGVAGYRHLCEQHTVDGYVDELQQFVSAVAELRFRGGILDERFIEMLAVMCDDVNDSELFATTLDTISGMLEGLESLSVNNHQSHGKKL